MSGAHVSRTDETRRVYFRIERNGQLATGIAPADITATIVNPADGASSTPAVTESTQKPGLYYFDLLAAFLTAVSEYGVVIEVSSLGPNVRTTFDFPVNVTQEDIDTVADGGLGTFDRTIAIQGLIEDTTLTRQMESNRLEMDFGTQELVLYEDDGLTVLHRWVLATDGGEPVATSTGVQTKRGAIGPP